MHGKYKIRVVKYCKRHEKLFEYSAAVHPDKNQVLWHRDQQLIVASVAHILKTTVDGNGETISLDFVEVEVMS